MTRLARGRDSLSLGTYDAPTSCMSVALAQAILAQAPLAQAFGSSPRGQVVVASRASHHASVVP